MAIQQGIYNRSFRVSVVVGTVLNFINQPQALRGFLFLDFHDAECLNVTKTLLTYAVPFFVATYGALTALNPRLMNSQNKPSAWR
jgi:hypothetical protein